MNSSYPDFIWRMMVFVTIAFATVGGIFFITLGFAMATPFIAFVWNGFSWVNVSETEFTALAICGGFTAFILLCRSFFVNFFLR